MQFRAKVLPRKRQPLIIPKRNLGSDHGRTSYMKLRAERGMRLMQMPTRIMHAGLALIAGSAFAAPGSAPQHIFMEAVSSPDGRHVVSVEGDASPSGGSPLQRDLVIRSMDGKTTTVVNLPCGGVAQCWPAAPAWAPDSRKVSFALRTPDSHARSLYQVSTDGGHATQLAAFDGTIADLRYGVRAWGACDACHCRRDQGAECR
jgi:hypothetical protein